jgi:hypothetical protein
MRAKASKRSRRSSSGRTPRQPARKGRFDSDPDAPSPKALEVRPVALADVRALIEEHHYLHSVPAAAVGAFGVFHDTKLVGGVVFTAGSTNAHRLLEAGRNGDVLTLSRLWLSDVLPRNSESRVISICLRMLRREGRWKAVVSYADPSAGHTGVIYQASGFAYLGQGPPESYVLLSDGKPHHPRSVFSRHGSNDVGHLRRTGVPSARVMVPGKHRYLVFLDPAWRWRLAAPLRPFPRGNARGPPLSWSRRTETACDERSPVTGPNKEREGSLSCPLYTSPMTQEAFS